MHIIWRDLVSAYHQELNCTTQHSPFLLAGLADLALWRNVTVHEQSRSAFKVSFKIQSTQGL